MIIAADIGNTNIHFGLFDKKELIAKFELSSALPRSSDEYFLFLSSILSGKEIPDGSIISSVVPSVTDPVRLALRRITGSNPIIVGPGVKTGFNIKLDSPSELGADIAANTAAVIDLFGEPTVFADFGSATVVSAVDASLSLASVVIMPGIRMGLDALSDTGLLPGVFSDKNLPSLPKNTSDSMRCGVIRGTAMSVRGFFEHFKKALSLPENTRLVVSGGFSEYVLPFLPKDTVFVSDLTLKGLETIHRLSTDKKR